MKIPESITNHQLINGLTLGQLVGNESPSVMPLHDLNSFKTIWENRLDDAKQYKNQELEYRAKSIIEFVGQNGPKLHMLLWAKHKISVLLSDQTENYLVINEHNHSQYSSNT